MESNHVTIAALRDRLRDLNTKAYYLLVALSFLYRTTSGSGFLKWALTLTALVAVLPDYLTSQSSLQGVRIFKVGALIAALVFTLIWLWSSTGPTIPTIFN